MNYIDQIADTIERGRDYGIANYNSVRESVGLKRLTNWTDINRRLFIDNPNV
jgi:hypothetical protein